MGGEGGRKVGREGKGVNEYTRVGEQKDADFSKEKEVGRAGGR